MLIFNISQILRQIPKVICSKNIDKHYYDESEYDFNIKLDILIIDLLLHQVLTLFFIIYRQLQTLAKMVLNCYHLDRG